jgi:NADP-dependent 3-hydroxy acid dehydrogenase YdfG
MNDLSNKTAVVTGAGSGIGRAMARRFSAAGMNLVLADMNEATLREAVAEANGTGVRAIGIRTDVSKADEMDNLAAKAFEEFERVHIICNNAGVAGAFLGAHRIDAKDWEWVLGVNLWGVIHGHRVFLPHLLEHNEGHIVNTASMAGHFPSHSAYGASKWAVVAISEGLHNSLAAEGSQVGVSCLCPGWVSTNIAASVRERPESVSPGIQAEMSTEEETRYSIVSQLVRDGLAPEHVANMVHDAVGNKSFWIFPHPEMVQMLPPRFAHIMGGTNPSSAAIL